MFDKSEDIYDAIYAFKDYVGEADRVNEFVSQHKRSRGNALFDVACGTGAHLRELQRYYQCEGIDLDPKFVEITSGRLNVPTHLGDMASFKLDHKFDVIASLFSSIGYVLTVDRLNATIKTFAEHLNPGGVAIVEPWITPEKFTNGTLGNLTVDRENLKIARMHISKKVGNQSHIDFHYLVGRPEGIQYFSENHRMGLFTNAEYRLAFESAGFETYYDAEGLTGRGLYIGTLK